MGAGSTVMSMVRVEWAKSTTAWTGARDVTRSHRGASQTGDSYPELFPKDFGERLERLTEVADLSWGSSPSASASMRTA